MWERDIYTVKYDKNFFRCASLLTTMKYREILEKTFADGVFLAGDETWAFKSSDNGS